MHKPADIKGARTEAENRSYCILDWMESMILQIFGFASASWSFCTENRRIQTSMHKRQMEILVRR